jgi:hypothetical protein
MILVKNFILFLCCLTFGLAAFSQSTNKASLDSLKKIVRKGPCRGGDQCNVRYIKACESLADFYNKTRNTPKAIYYYKLVTDLTVYTDSDLGYNDKAIDLRARICLKLGDLYFKAANIPNHLDTAIYYHTKGLIHFKKADISKYSMQYFNNVLPFITLASNDSIEIIVNPLYFGKKEISDSLMRSSFAPLIQKLQADKTLYCDLNMGEGYLVVRSMEAEAGRAQLLTAAANFFKSLGLEKQVNINWNPFEFALMCEYKGVKVLPCWKVTFGHLH